MAFLTWDFDKQSYVELNHAGLGYAHKPYAFLKNYYKKRPTAIDAPQNTTLA